MEKPVATAWPARKGVQGKQLPRLPGENGRHPEKGEVPPDLPRILRVLVRKESQPDGAQEHQSD